MSLCTVQRSAKTARVFLRRTSTDEKSQSVGPSCRLTSWDAYNFDRCLHGKKQASSSTTFSLYEFRFSFGRNDDRGALTPNGDAARKKQTEDANTLSLIVVNPLTG